MRGFLVSQSFPFAHEVPFATGLSHGSFVCLFVAWATLSNPGLLATLSLTIRTESRGSNIEAVLPRKMFFQYLTRVYPEMGCKVRSEIL